MPINVDDLKELDDSGWKTVKIGTITLGEKNDDLPDQSKPNPASIEWSQEFGITEQPVVGRKPVTIVTQPWGLWKCVIEVNTLKTRPEVLDKILEWDVGPRIIEDSLHTKCMLLKKKSIKQRKATKDYYRAVVLEFVENNPGVA